MLHGKRYGFTRVDLLGAAISVLFVAGMACGYVACQRNGAARVTCAFNLKEIRVAESTFEKDHGGAVPWMLLKARGGTLEYSTSGIQAFRHFQGLSNDLNTCVFLACPQDVRTAATRFDAMANSNVSYFIGIDSRPDLAASIFHGDRNVTALSSRVLQVTRYAPPAWDKSVGLHGNRGNLVFGDGHVEEVESTGLSNAIQRTGVATNHFAVP